MSDPKKWQTQVSEIVAAALDSLRTVTGSPSLWFKASDYYTRGALLVTSGKPEGYELLRPLPFAVSRDELRGIIGGLIGKLPVISEYEDTRRDAS